MGGNGRVGEWGSGGMGEWERGRMGEWESGRVGVRPLNPISHSPIPPLFPFPHSPVPPFPTLPFPLYHFPELSSCAIVHTTGFARKLSRTKQAVNPSKVFSHRALARHRDSQSTPTLFDNYVIDETVLAKVHTRLPQSLLYFHAFGPKRRAL